jgi:universal stress protein A
MRTMTTQRTTKPATRPQSRSRLHTVRSLPVAFPNRIKSILVPIDFSKPSEKALDFAVSLARQFGAKLTLLSVIEPFPTPDFAYYPLAMESEKMVAATKKRLEKVPVKAGAKQELIEKTVVRNGVPFKEITAAARSLKVDLIVISTHGYSGLAHVFLGSTAERVVRHAECPVLVVRGCPEKSHAQPG